MKRTPVSQCLAAIFVIALSACANAPLRGQERYSFELTGGFFYGPGPIVPDTSLPDGRLRNIRFDRAAFRGYCEFANDDSSSGRLSDGRTRVNQNIDAGHLLIGGGTSSILLAAVDGGPHRGTEQYYLDDQYRFVWRVDIALDPGFEEGIIRLDDFVLDTGVVRIGNSLQSRRGDPGGYDQAGSLTAGAFLAGRVGDFDQDGYLDGILVAAPNVPLAADMLPGAPVGNRRGFRTNIPIAAELSTELMLRGALHLREPLQITLQEAAPESHAILLADLSERLHVIQERARGIDAAALVPRLVQLRDAVAAMRAEGTAEEGRLMSVFSAIDALIDEVAALNARAGMQLPPARVAAQMQSQTELHRKSY